MDLFVKYLKSMVYDNYAKGNSFIPADKLKPKVLNNALKTFARGCSQETVIALCDLAGFRHGTAGYLLTEDKMFCHERYSAEECDKTIDIRNIDKYIAVTGFWFDINLPVNFEELEEDETTAEDYTAFILQYENGDQILLHFKDYYVDIRNTLDAIVIAKRMAEDEREAVIKAGDKAFKLKDYREAFRYYAKAYDVEIAKGARMIGHIYDHGLGVARNDKLAMEWYLKGAELNDADAQVMCAVCYQLGYGGKIDLERSYLWMSRAADNGNVDAMKQCAKMCASGTGVRQSDGEALLWYENAAYFGDAEAQYILGRAYEEGRYCEKDEFEALSWFKKAAEKNHTLAMAKCAAIYAQSNQIVKDFDQAIGYAEKAYANGFHEIETLLNYLKQVQREEQSRIAELTEKATHGDEGAMYALVDIYLDEHGHCYDAVKGMQWMEKIADRGNTEKMIECADLYNSRNIRLRNPSRAFHYYEKAAILGNCKAQFICGLACEEGEGTKQDYEKARNWYRKAADQGYASAMHNLALLLLTGEGGERNAYESERLLRQSAAMGNSVSKEVLDKYF